MRPNNTHVYVGMSGGVDSSVTAALLKDQGYRVTGVYMKNWTQDLPGMKCPWADDLADAKRVAVHLGIDFKVFDFQTQYRQRVVDHMIAEYQAGRTPNPDVMCNQEIKFKLFLDTALEDGADMIATGHYARVSRSTTITSISRHSQPAWESSHKEDPYSLDSRLRGNDAAIQFGNNTAVGSPGTGPVGETGIEKIRFEDVSKGLVGEQRTELLTATDTNKDQTYFLYRITAAALAKTFFPIGEFTKPQVRQLAQKFNLVTAGKKDSQGICFVGEVGIKEFLQQYVRTTPGPIIDKKTSQIIGQHDGAIFYTIGQRHGLGIGGGLPYYVTSKDMSQNIIYVTTDLNDQNLWRSELTLTNLHWINGAPEGTRTYSVRTRYRAPLINATLRPDGDQLHVTLADPDRAITPGQSAVIYDDNRVVGGGVVV